MRKLFLFISYVVLVSGCNASPPEQTAELRQAYEKFHEIYTLSPLTSDTSQLDQVATGKVLKSAITRVEKQKSLLLSQDTTIQSFLVLEYDGNRAMIETQVFYNHFSQDLKTGERHYYSKGKVLYLVEMVKEDGTWKVSEEKLERSWD